MADLRKKIADLTGASEAEQAVRERLELLKNAAEARLALAQAKLAAALKGQGEGLEQLYIVPDAILEAEYGYNVVASEGMDEGLKNAVDSFFKGSKEDVRQGFQAIVHSALSALFADTSAGEQTKEYYFVTMEHNAFIRVDLYVWKYYFKQRGLSKACSRRSATRSSSRSSTTKGSAPTQ